ncbi:MAG: hypothetical protein QG652_1375 [Pseudomonadota bacterium]|nr:hypothetical protein [Pseudomonadota bacterium]
MRPFFVRVVYPDELFCAVGNAAFFQIVRCQLNGYLVAGHDTNVVFTHLARDVGCDNMAIFELYPKHGIGQRVDHRAIHL